MSKVYELLEESVEKAQRDIRKKLSGLLGFAKRTVYNSYMPLSINLISEEDGYVITFENDGYISLNKGLYAEVDIEIKAASKVIVELLETKDKSLFQKYQAGGKLQITTYTSSGKNFLNRVKGML